MYPNQTQLNHVYPNQTQPNHVYPTQTQRNHVYPNQTLERHQPNQILNRQQVGIYSTDNCNNSDNCDPSSQPGSLHSFQGQDVTPAVQGPFDVTAPFSRANYVENGDSFGQILAEGSYATLRRAPVSRSASVRARREEATSQGTEDLCVEDYKERYSGHILTSQL